MNPDDAIDMGREAINTVMMVGGPVLLVGVVLGILIGIVQAMTQVQDQTVSFVPKVLVMLLCLGLALPWLSERMMDFARTSFGEPAIGMSARSDSPAFSVSTERPRAINHYYDRDPHNGQGGGSFSEGSQDGQDARDGRDRQDARDGRDAVEPTRPDQTARHNEFRFPQEFR